MKICVITPLYSIAGVPLAQHRFAKALAERGYEVDLIVGFIDAGYTIPNTDGFNFINFNVSNVRSMLIPLIKYLIKSRPKVIFSAEDHLNLIVILASLISFSKVLISGSSRVTPFDTYSNKIFSKRWFLKILMTLFIWRANVLTCVSEDMVQQYKKIFKNSKHQCVYNIIVDKNNMERINDKIDEEWLINKSIPVIIAAGRLAYWKGFDTLIKAFHIIIQQRSVRLIILGDGPERIKLQSLINTLKLNHCIKLYGYVSNPLKFFKSADVFVLSSIVEGLPNVLVEAMMCGCTPVATDCPTGPREVLQGGTIGNLVETNNPISLANGIIHALDNPVSIKQLNNAIYNFRSDVVINKHLKLLNLYKD